MKRRIQCLCTLYLTPDEYALLLNKQSGTSVEVLVQNLINHRKDDISFDFPALALNLEIDESLSS